MVDTLADRYTRSRRPVVFIEHDLDNMDKGQQRRQSMWFQARAGANSAQTPLVMVDSGWKWAEGAVSNQFERVYSGLVDDALARPPDVDIDAYYRRTGSVVDVTAKITNWTETSLAGTSLTAILYEDKKVLHTGRAGRAAVAAAISGNVLYGESGTYQLQLTVPAGVNWSLAHIVVVVDRRKLAGAGYEAMQGAMAVEGVPPTATPDPPTATPVPTDEPTATATTRPTDPPEPTSTGVPTIAPTPVPTAAPRYAIFAPALYRRHLFDDGTPSR